MSATCAAEGCSNQVVRRQGQVGRPPIYCSPRCRPSGGQRQGLVVELAHHEVDDDVSPVTIGWMVSLRRGTRHAVLASCLGRFSAELLVREICDVIGTQCTTREAPIE